MAVRRAQPEQGLQLSYSFVRLFCYRSYLRPRRNVAPAMLSHGLAARKARGPQQGKLVLQRQRRVEVDEHIRRDVRASPAARAFRPQQSLLFLAAGDVSSAASRKKPPGRRAA